ncbi:MAG: site-specific integrase [Deltaproteobacteria bacterium]|nr:site-specific integrase [Deltaproteobacteria bacterium]MCX7953082.1 site-specific integrase [Deltaproteobacteria bacterium]
MIFSEGSSKVFLTIMAFLSGKAELTKLTYLGVLREYIEFLKMLINDPKVSLDEAIQNVSPVDAVKFIEYVKKKPGIRPRFSVHDWRADFSHPEVSLPASMSINRTSLGKLSKEFWQSPASIRKKITILRKIYKVLQSNGLVEINPFASELVTIPRSGAEKRPTEMIDFHMVNKIIEAVSRGKEPVRSRDMCLLSFLFFLGLRRSEAVNLLMSDLHVSPSGTSYIRLRKTKSGKDDILPLNEGSREALKKWLEVRNNFKIKSVYLFPSSCGRNRLKIDPAKPVSASNVWRIFKKACAIAGLPPSFSPHSARATAITKLLSDGFDFKAVKAFSRHSSITMVERYDKRRMSIEENPALKLKF